jgi:hypothetical protein
VNIAHFCIGQLHHAQVTVYKTAFGKLAREEKSLAKITRNKRTVFKLRFGDLLAMQVEPLEVLCKNVHVIGDWGKSQTKALWD